MAWCICTKPFPNPIMTYFDKFVNHIAINSIFLHIKNQVVIFCQLNNLDISELKVLSINDLGDRRLWSLVLICSWLLSHPFYLPHALNNKHPYMATLFLLTLYPLHLIEQYVLASLHILCTYESYIYPNVKIIRCNNPIHSKWLITFLVSIIISK